MTSLPSDVDIHQYPELGFDVHRTAGIAADALQALEIPVKTGIGRTGVVGDLEVLGATKRIALRADMDALPIQELTDVPYKSKIDGKSTPLWTRCTHGDAYRHSPDPFRVPKQPQNTR